jgi:purine-binding chemotaxis protein CheW
MQQTSQITSMIGFQKRKIGKRESYLAFKIGTETYGLEIVKIQEIVEISNITYIPINSYFIRGMITVKGKTVNVMELPSKFSTGHIRTNVAKHIIVADILWNDGVSSIGIIADEIAGITYISDDDLEPVYGSDDYVTGDYFKGIAKIGLKEIVLLDLEKVFTPFPAFSFQVTTAA